MYKWLDAAHTKLRRLADEATIPVDAENIDFKQALAWAQANGPIPEPDPPSQAELDEQARLAAIDATIKEDTVIQTLKPMTNAQFDAWWAANVTNLAQANNVLKRVVRILVRRVL